MNRREFITKTSKAALGALSYQFILPNFNVKPASRLEEFIDLEHGIDIHYKITGKQKLKWFPMGRTSMDATLYIRHQGDEYRLATTDGKTKRQVMVKGKINGQKLQTQYMWITKEDGPDSKLDLQSYPITYDYEDGNLTKPVRNPSPDPLSALITHNTSRDPTQFTNITDELTKSTLRGEQNEYYEISANENIGFFSNVIRVYDSMDYLQFKIPTVLEMDQYYDGLKKMTHMRAEMIFKNEF